MYEVKYIVIDASGKQLGACVRVAGYSGLVTISELLNSEIRFDNAVIMSYGLRGKSGTRLQRVLCGKDMVLRPVNIVGALKFSDNLSIGGSVGNLPKLVAKDAIGGLWFKGRSRSDSYEPEAEFCAYRLALLFGINVVPCDLVRLEKLGEQKVSVSRDFASGCVSTSLFKYVIYKTGFSPAEFEGREKLNLVESVLAIEDRGLHRDILLFDYIIANTDRHLRNFDVLFSECSGEVRLAPMFDNGASLFSTETEEQIKIRFYETDNSVHSKPYADPHRVQLSLLASLGHRWSLRMVKRGEIYRIVNSCFDGERARLIGRYIVENTERVGLLYA